MSRVSRPSSKSGPAPGSRPRPGASTLAIHSGQSPDPASGAIVTPIVQSTTYVQAAVGRDKGHTYTRCSNPTVSALEANLGGLESDLPAACFGAGLGAELALFLTVLSAGDHVVLGDVIYGGTYRLLEEVLRRFGVSASWVDTSEAPAVAGAIRENTRLVFIETPANPTLKLTDISAIASITRRAGITLAVDNTFLTPVGQQPLDLGADLCVYSTTKHIEGHNTAVGGAITTRNSDLLDRIRYTRKTAGSIQAPFDAWLTQRGLKTLPLRLRQHTENALAVAQWLEGHDLVERVLYPGLSSFPQAELAARQHILHGGLLAFEVRGGEAAGRALMNNVKLCSLAESLGSVETLITHPVTMTHGSIPRPKRLAAGISDGLVRLSVGLEDPADVIADLESALEHARGVGGATLERAAVGANGGGR